MACPPELIKELRERTGAGVMDCKRALEESDCNVDQAVKVIEAKGLERAEKRAGREASQGAIECYVHQGRIGAMIELNCETDFVARTEDFKKLAREVAMQVASMNPQFLSKEDVPEHEQGRAAELALLDMPYIREPSKTIGQLVTEVSAKTGEKVAVRRFVRYELGGQ